MTSTGPDPTGRAGHEHDRDYVDKDVDGDIDGDVDGSEPVEREGDFTDKDVAPATSTEEREGEYTDSDVGPDDTDPPVGSYTDRDR